jgi:hypothetical protein
LATSTFTSKLLQTLSVLLANASTDLLERSISQSFHKLTAVSHQAKTSCGKHYSARSAAL